MNDVFLNSVNETTNKKAPQETMIQLGLTLKRLIATMADAYDISKPFQFCKLDIKDGFWRMVVSYEDAWNFCYILPAADGKMTDIDDAEIVVPHALQMGWCESPPFFCAASETARDVIEALLQETRLPTHPFENKMTGESKTSAALRLQASATFTNLVEVFVDDFIAATNCTDKHHLEHFYSCTFGRHHI